MKRFISIIKRNAKTIALWISIVVNIVTIPILIVQAKQYTIEKERWEMEQKENTSSIRTSYLLCDIKDIGVLVDDKDFYIVQNELSDLYSQINTNNGLYEYDQDVMNVLGRDYEGTNYKSQVVFLFIESFGKHNLGDLKVSTTVYNDSENIKRSCYDYTEFDKYKDNKYANFEEYVFKFGDRSVGEKILIPLMIIYDCKNDDSDPLKTYVYKKIYIPETVEFKDLVTDEKQMVDARDVLVDKIQMNAHYVVMG